MSLESATYISQLVATNPTSGDPKSQGDDHLRLLKSVLQAQFPNLGATAANFTAAEANYLVGVTSGIQAQLNAKAPLASPALTGTPTVPTASALTNNTQAASTAYADAAVAVEAARATAAESSLNTLKAPLASPAFTGNPTAPTPTAGDNSTSIATTAFATGLAFSAALPGTGGVPDGYTIKRVAGATAWAPGPNVQVSARTSNTILALADQGYLLDYTSGTFSQTLTAAATLGNGWYCWVRNSGTGVVTFDPNGSETIGGATTAALNPGDVWLITCDGTNFRLVRIQGMNKQIYTSGSGNFTVPAGVYRVYVECWGAGGGSASVASAAGGGGGGYSAGWLNTTPGGTLAYAVGAGGTGAGGNTTFGGTFTANGGSAGSNNAAVSGGSASGGDFNIAGGYGLGSAASIAIGGGSTCGGNSLPLNGTNAVNGIAPGGGGVTLNSAGTAIGGDGRIVIRWV